ncbi:30S ribosome-binding factor RbfA [candidate division KSB1 bacterium]|nr:30S ribosome-binding factor RbfA [candidate division KSB1 bacterium]
MQKKRNLRVAEQLRKEIAQIFQTGIQDPHLKMLTITQVTVSPDLRVAKVFLSVIGDLPARTATLEALEHAKSFIRNLIGQRMALRYTPELIFRYDDTVDYVDNIERLFKQIHAENPDSEQTAP